MNIYLKSVLILPINCRGGIVAMLWALPASAKEIMVKQSRLFIFVFTLSAKFN